MPIPIKGFFGKAPNEPEGGNPGSVKIKEAPLPCLIAIGITAFGCLVLFFFPDKSGFFYFQRFTYGTVETNLYYLENEVIRARFQDPRLHFALNCASSSCPPLPREPFIPERLNQQLDREARAFINDTNNVRFDSSQNILYLNSIFKWYEDDFVAWLRQNRSTKNPTLTDYVRLYLDKPARDDLGAHPEPATIEFLPYDWGLND